MIENGFRYWATPENPILDSRDFPYAIDDVAWAQKHGYGSDIARRIDALRRSDPNTRYLESLPPRRRTAAITALNGDDRRGTLEVRLPSGAIIGRSTGGCTANAQRSLYGDLKTWFEAKEVTANLAEIRRMRVVHDPAYTAGTRLLLDCMRARGHDYQSLDQPRAVFLGPHASNKRTAEIATAVAEAKCAASMGFSALASRLDHKYGEEIAEKYRSVYATKVRLERKALTRARSALKDR